MIIHYTQDIDAQNGQIVLSGDEAQHCVKVLRKRLGDEIYVTDGEGRLYTCSLTDASRTRCEAKIMQTEVIPQKGYYLTISICPTKKQSRIEWFVEKAVEIGVSRIIFTQTKRTEKSRLKKERLSKIVVSAMKQSKNLYLPEIITDYTWSDLINRHDLGHRYIAHCEDPDTHLAKVCPVGEDCIVAIGPEGDFSAEEIESALSLGWKEVNLGSSRLRTETAGVVAASVIAQINI